MLVTKCIAGRYRSCRQEAEALDDVLEDISLEVQTAAGFQ